LQGVAWIGPYGLSLLTVAAAAALVPLLAETGFRRKSAGAALLLAPIAVLAAAGGVRLATAPAPDNLPMVPGVTLRLVQPNIEQREKWRPELRARHFARHLRLSEGAAAAGITHVIWPEAATPFLLTESPEALRQIGAVTPAGGATILGTPRRRAADGLYGNAVVTVSHRGKIGEIYDKHQLVPFGEYIPFENWLPLERLAAGRGSFAPGAGPRSVAVPGAPPFSPLVCYEAIFPRKVAASDNRPGWLLNVTNDAWFGKSDGPFQHLSIARLRSIEEGLPMVRVANTGVSAAIDPYGRIIDRLGLGETGVLDIQLPRPVASPLYANAGDGSFVLILLFFFSSYAFQARRKR